MDPRFKEFEDKFKENFDDGEIAEYILGYVNPVILTIKNSYHAECPSLIHHLYKLYSGEIIYACGLFRYQVDDLSIVVRNIEEKCTVRVDCADDIQYLDMFYTVDILNILKKY